jgi:hypothetical protein
VNLQGSQIQGLPFDFDQLESSLVSMSEAMWGRETNGTVAVSYGQLSMTGSEPGLNVFNVAAQQLASANSIRVSTPAGATALINVSGQSVTLSNLQVSLVGVSRSALLWNMPEATLFKLRSISFQGSALAPRAYADVSNGNFEGTLVAQSVVGSMQFHDYPLTAWASLGAATPSTSVTLRPNARLRSGCEYTFILAAFPANAAGDCLPSDTMQSFLVADTPKSAFDREVGSRRLRYPAEVPVSFTALKGINSLVPDVFARYANELHLRAGTDTLAALTTPKASRLNPAWDVVRYRQLYRGVPVQGYGYLVHQDGEVFRQAVGQLLPGLALSTEPSISVQQAIAGAVQAVNPAVRPWEGGGQGQPPAGQLIIKPATTVPAAASAKLAWRISLFEIEEAEYVDVDATDGHVLFIQPRQRGISACSGFDHATATLDHHEDRTLRIPLNAGTSVARSDLSVGLYNQDGNPFEVFQNTEPMRYRTRFLSEASGALTDSVCAGGDADTLAVARAHWSVQNAARSIDSLFGWRGLRGDGTGDLVVTAVNPLAVDQSKYDTVYLPPEGVSSDQIVVTYRNLFPDVVAHEFGHGVSRYSREMQGQPARSQEGESGALEEAYGDILASLVTYESGLALNTDMWCPTGDDGVGCKRNLRDPNSQQQPDTYLGEHWGPVTPGDCSPINDFCSVHQNATVVGHWFYTLVNGRGGDVVNDFSCASSVHPLGGTPDESMSAAGQLVFESFALMDDEAGFLAARDVTAAVAEEMFGDVEAKVSAEKAWHAVGVGEGPRPLLIAPLDGETAVNPWQTRFRFSIGTDQGPWTIRYSTDSTFTSADYVTITSTVWYDGIQYAEALIALNSDTKYYWQAKEGGDNSQGADWDKCGTFTASFTTAEKVVALRIPDSKESGGYYLTNNMGQVVWEPLEGAYDYEALLRDSDDGCEVPASEWTSIPISLDRISNPELFLGDTIDQNIVLLRDPIRLRPDLVLDPNLTYHLYIRGLTGDGARGTCTHFKVRKLQLMPFEKLSPLDYVDIPYNSGGPFVWTPSVGAREYQFTIRRWPPDGSFETVLQENIDADSVTINAAGNVEHFAGDPSVTGLPGEMMWDVWAVHETGDKRPGWDPGSPGLTNHARFWNSADRIIEGVTESGEHGPPTDNGNLPISIVFPTGAEPRETQSCFKAPANTIGMLWVFTEGGNVSWDDLSDVRIPADASDEFSLCTPRLTMTQDVMYLLAIPYSNVIEADWHDDWLSGYGPQSVFVYNARTCGGIGDECCQGSSSCVDGAICQAGVCNECGGQGQACCPSYKCGSHDLACSGNKCVSCGGPGEVCCNGSICDTNATCGSGDKCKACGGLGETCCPKTGCRSANATCKNDVCKALQECNSTLQSGANSPSSFEIEMGQNEGSTRLYMNTYTVPDNIQVYYEGKAIRGTGCFGTATLAGCQSTPWGAVCCEGNGWCSIPIAYGPGNSTSLVVEVEPNCSGTPNTQWEFRLACPD